MTPEHLADIKRRHAQVERHGRGGSFDRATLEVLARHA